MYQNIMITVIAAIVVFWFIYDEVLARFINKPGKAISELTEASMETFNAYRRIQIEFENGNFDQVIALADELIAEKPFNCSTLSCKAYALYHQKKYAEAKEIFLLLDTLPDQNSKKMLDKINDILT